MYDKFWAKYKYYMEQNEKIDWKQLNVPVMIMWWIVIMVVLCTWGILGYCLIKMELDIILGIEIMLFGLVILGAYIVWKKENLEDESSMIIDEDKKRRKIIWNLLNEFNISYLNNYDQINGLIEMTEQKKQRKSEKLRLTKVRIEKVFKNGAIATIITIVISNMADQLSWEVLYPISLYLILTVYIVIVTIEFVLKPMLGPFFKKDSMLCEDLIYDLEQFKTFVAPNTMCTNEFENKNHQTF